MIVTFCGHRELSDADGSLRSWLKETVENLILRGADVFYLGGYGDFDRMAASVVRELKKRYPQVESVLVLPYLDSKMDTSGYDSTTYPPLEHVQRRFAISHRNRWMVLQADVLVAYVICTWGGAYQTLEYARRKKKEIFLYHS